MPHVRTTIAGAILAALTLAGCSGAGGNARTVSEGNPDACPGVVVDAVVSVSQWSGVVEALGGDCVTVTTVVSSAVDPHDFEATTGDLAAFSQADLAVLNGAGYDSWAADAVGSLDDAAPRVVSAAEFDRRGGDDPHVWYDPAAVDATSVAISEVLTELSPASADYLAERAASWDAELERFRGAVEELRAAADTMTYAATESVFDRMADAAGLTDVTPEGYRRAAANESEPAPGDLAAFEAALADGSVDVLIYNVQTAGSVPEQLRAAAEDAGVPVVEVTESAPDDAGSFLAWQSAELEELSAALGRP
jgi:zinc/manganese transport system substrate-binding protein